MLFRKNPTVCSKPLTFEKDRDTRNRSESSDSSETAGERWFHGCTLPSAGTCIFLQRKLTEHALQKDGNGDGPAAGVMRQTILSRERAETDRQRDRRREVC